MNKSVGGRAINLGTVDELSVRDVSDERSTISKNIRTLEEIIVIHIYY